MFRSHLTELLFRRVHEEGEGLTITRVVFEMTAEDSEDSTVTMTSRVYIVRRIYQTGDWFILVPVVLVQESTFSFEREIIGDNQDKSTWIEKRRSEDA